MIAADEILYANDLQLLGYILGEMVEIVSMLEDNKEKAKLLTALNDFYAIHKTRTNDLLKLQRSIEKARNKHRKVVAERDQYLKNWKESKQRLEEYMEKNIS